MKKRIELWGLSSFFFNQLNEKKKRKKKDSSIQNSKFSDSTKSNGLLKKTGLKVKLVCKIFEVITGFLHHVFHK